jgi:AraC-like DNA-binding protein
VPAGRRYRLRAESPLAEVVTLLIGPHERRAAQRDYRDHIDERRFVELLSVQRVMPRTRWVDEVVHRYVFERDACGKHRSRAAVFLEIEIAKEIYFLCQERDEQRTRASVLREEGGLVPRARALIDASLSERLGVRELARRCHASESTLLRAFARELGTTPGSYARERRLEAAVLLLEAGRFSVTEVAERVGYASLPSFTTAFAKRFGAAPSSLLRRDAGLELVPPGGAPQRRKR